MKRPPLLRQGFITITYITFISTIISSIYRGAYKYSHPVSLKVMRFRLKIRHLQ